MRCIAESKTNREIAATLLIAEAAAELPVSRIRGKLNRAPCRQHGAAGQPMY
ncbi:MAG TPA: hypothetical protein VNL35_13800 [Chloroflexota bacterium]|nr:hypothetical protein [Chloroflexota bacterium]